MSEAAVYDRHEYIKDLIVAGADQDLAEAIALGAVRVQESTLATKEDIAELKMGMAKLEASTREDIAELKMGMAKLEASTREDIAELKMGMAELKTAMAEQESRLIKWVVGTAGIVVALIKFLP